jgi:hypothetical protein
MCRIRNQRDSRIFNELLWWARQDLNLGPTEYENPAPEVGKATVCEQVKVLGIKPN